MAKFHGTLTIKNVEFVAKSVLEMLNAKRYTFVSVYEYKNFEPETRVHQELKNGTNGSPLSVWFDEKNVMPEFAGFNFCDSYGSWGLSTSQKDGYYDSNFDAPYIVIDWNSITMTLRTPAGLLAYWQITLE